MSKALFNPHERPKSKKWDGRKLRLKRIEVKNDGYRATYVFTADGKKKLVGRNLVDYFGEMIEEDRDDLLSRFSKVPPRTIVDGELFLRDRPASEISHAFKDGGDFYFQPFAVPIYEGRNRRPISFETRDQILAECDFSAPMSLALSAGQELTPEWLKEQAKILQIEGWILKENHWGNWWKCKPTKTVDAFVVGCKPGVGKHKGRLGALEVAVYHAVDGIAVCEEPAVRIASVGKGNDDAWRDMTPFEVLGKVCEVEYEEVQARGRLKFSNFVRWRDDKPMEECTDEQLA